MNNRVQPFEIYLGMVEDVGDEYAIVRDSFGRRRDIRLLPRRGGGPLPRVGEQWIIDRALGDWSFSSLLKPVPIEITGEDRGNPGLRNVADALEAMGLAINNLTAGGGSGEDEGGIIIPAGTVFPYSGSEVPAGFLLCNGQAVSREEYDELFEEIGTTYGAGDGSTTFNVPDLIRRFPLGAGTTSGVGRAGSSSPGDAGGNINHTHSGPSHTHSMSHSHAVSHTHSIDPPNTATTSDSHSHSHLNSRMSFGSAAGGTSGPSSGQAGNDHRHEIPNTDTDTHNHSVNIAAFTSGGSSISSTGGSSSGSTGGGGTGETGAANPPFLVLNYIISAGALRGERGIQGEPGEDGADGAMWHSAAGAPSSGTGAVGDFYLDSNNGNVYEKTDESTWTFRDNLTGPQGPPGIQGEQGETGPQGPKGDKGDPGDPVNLGDLLDVDLTGLQDGDGIVYDEQSQTWVPGASGGGDAGVADILMLGGM